MKQLPCSVSPNFAVLDGFTFDIEKLFHPKS
jgi:hypothetical protein